MNIKSLVLGLAVAASLGSTARANLVLNGSLEKPGDTSSPNFFCNTPGVNCPGGNPYPTTGHIPNWDVHGASGSTTYNAIYTYDVLGGALPQSMPPSYYSCTTALGFISGNACANPDGEGHFINLDGDPAFRAAISQLLPVGGANGLITGQQYRLTFSWAAVQRANETGPIWGNYLDVSVGNQQFLTQSIGTFTAPLPNQGFSGWMTENYDFTWNGVGSVLNFLSNGQPTGHPPSINLDGISLNAIPEPPMWALLITAGFGLVGVSARRRRQAVVAD